MEELKTCSKCKRTLPISQFYRNARNKDGYHSACKECHNKEVNAAKAKKRAKANLQPIPEGTFVLSLANISIDKIKEELRKRGYSGELRYNKVITI